MNIKQKINYRFNTLSYTSKFRILFYGIFLIVFILLVAVGTVSVNYISHEIYDSNRDKLSVLSLNVENSLTHIESITTEIHRSTTIQQYMAKSNHEQLSEYDIAQIQNGLSDEVNWLLADQNDVTAITIVNLNKKRMTNTASVNKSFFGGYSLNQLTNMMNNSMRQGKWIFSKRLQNAVYIQNLFNTRNGITRKEGTVIISVNTGFVQGFLNSSGLFSSKDYLVVKYGNQYISTNNTNYNQSINYLKQASPTTLGSKSYRISRINNNKYFIQSTTPQNEVGDFTFFYFLLNNQLIEKLLKIIACMIIVIVIVLFLGVRVVNRLVERLLSPIHSLARTMRKFDDKSDFEKLRAVEVPSELVERTDEIGDLYASFHQLMIEIEDLVIKDYRSQILTQEIEYKYLQAQLDPHFLFNTLNSINWMAINNGNADISEMVTALAVLFRKKVNINQKYESVSNELETINAYLKIQSVRFKNRLVYRDNIDLEVKSILIPQLIIQPLIENSIKYGVQKIDRSVTIILSIQKRQEQLVISVIDDGPGFIESSMKSTSTGVGLNNIKDRIKLIYGDSAKLEINSIKNLSTRVSIILPITKEMRGDEKGE